VENVRIYEDSRARRDFVEFLDHHAYFFLEVLGQKFWIELGEFQFVLISPPKRTRAFRNLNLPNGFRRMPLPDGMSKSSDPSEMPKVLRSLAGSVI
jgi:hypothetical protein